VTERKCPRHRLEIQYEILCLCRGRGKLQSEVLLSANLNQRLFFRLSGELEAAGLLRRVFEGGRLRFVTSEAGREFVRGFEKLMRMVEAAVA
jgi:predicted transcriptional regulator